MSGIAGIRNRHQIENHCGQSQVFPYLFFIENRSIGFVELHRVLAIEYRIYRVFISSEHRGQNLAQRMLKLLIKKARVEFNGNVLTLGVFSHNKSAISCYEKLGFVKSDTIANSLSFNDESWELVHMTYLPCVDLCV